MNMSKSRSPSLTQFGNRAIDLAKYQRKLQTQPNGCIEWTGPVNNCGYGLMGFLNITTDKFGMMTPHRMALIIKLGREIAPGMNANHFVCHNKICCNPDHISEGTQQEKIEQMVDDGRLIFNNIGSGPYLHKQWNRTYKYSDDEIQWIRTADVEELMAKYNLNKAQAYRRRHAFRHGYCWLEWEPK
jgi:hypothetical protein